MERVVIVLTSKNPDSTNSSRSSHIPQATMQSGKIGCDAPSFFVLLPNDQQKAVYELLYSPFRGMFLGVLGPK